jgi:hypothetical protein
MFLARLAMFSAASIVAITLAGCIPRDFYSSKSPDGKKTVTVRKVDMPPHFGLWVNVRDGWFSHTIYDARSDAWPRYAEALWESNTSVLVLACDSFGDHVAVGYDFDQKMVSERAARKRIGTYLVDRYRPNPEALQKWRGEPIDWYCGQKIGL